MNLQNITIICILEKWAIYIKTDGCVVTVMPIPRRVKYISIVKRRYKIRLTGNWQSTSFIYMMFNFTGCFAALTWITFYEEGLEVQNYSVITISSFMSNKVL